MQEEWDTPLFAVVLEVYMNIEKKVRDLIEPVVTENGYVIESISYVQENSLYFLRVVIDKVGMIDVEDCVAVSKLINPLLDENDPIEDDNYILDVCSKEGSD